MLLHDRYWPKHQGRPPSSARDRGPASPLKPSPMITTRSEHLPKHSPKHMLCSSASSIGGGARRPRTHPDRRLRDLENAIAVALLVSRPIPSRIT